MHCKDFNRSGAPMNTRHECGQPVTFSAMSPLGTKTEVCGRHAQALARYSYVLVRL